MLVQEADGKAGTVDLKLGGIVPIANLARFHALANGVTVSGTLDRLEAVGELGALDRDTVAALGEAFSVVTKIRLDHHVQRIRAGLPPDNHVDPKALRPLERGDLREAFRAVADAQKQLAHYVPLGI